MANLAKFNASKIKLYGNVQETVDEAETLVAGNAIIAMNLTYDENITNKTDALAGDLLDRNTINSVTDRFGEVSFDTYLPYLGEVAGTVEVALLTFTASGSNTLFVSGNTFTITSGSNTVTGEWVSASTLTQAVDELIAYINDGTAGTTFDFTDTAGTGRVGIHTDYTLNNSTGSANGIVTFVSNTPATNVANLTKGGTTGRTTLAVTDGIASSVSTIPVASFLESSSLAQTITYKLGLTSALRANYTNASSKLVIGVTAGNNALANITTVITEVTKLRNNLKTTEASRALAVTLLTNLNTLKTEVTSAVSGTTNSLTIVQSEALLPLQNFDASVILEDYTTAVSDLITDTATALATLSTVRTTKIDDLQDHATWGTTELLADLIAIIVNSTTASALEAAKDAKKAAREALEAGITQLTRMENNTTLNSGTTSAFITLTAADTAIDSYTVANLVLSGVSSISFSNDTASDTSCTYHIRKPSIDLEAVEKTIVLKDVKSTVDLTIAISERPMLKFNAHGNIDLTSDEDAFTYDITSQKTAVADVTTSANMVNASITPTGEAAYSNNVCFQKLSVPNFDGFTHTRTQTGCGNFWLPEATAHDFTMTILEDSATADGITNFNPVDSINKEFTVVVQQGTVAGKRFTVTLTGCTLTNFKNTTVGNVAAQDLTFSFSGRATLLLD